YRFLSFGEGQPDPGGLAFMVSMRLPTGQKENLRGLDITRTQLSFIASGGRGRFRPHGSAGYEFRSKGVTVTSDLPSDHSVTARHQLLFAGGLELEAAPKCTLLVDLLGSQIYGGGRLGLEADAPTPGFTASQSLVALPKGLFRLLLAPGVKVNVKG